MTDTVIFGFGCLVTIMCAAVVALLLRAAYLDGKHDEFMKADAPQEGVKSVL